MEHVTASKMLVLYGTSTDLVSQLQSFDCSSDYAWCSTDYISIR